MKRSGDNGHLSREEYEAQEDDEEEAGTYKKASAEKMASRKIVKRGSKFSKFGSQNVAPSNVADASTPSSAFSSLPIKEAPKAGGVFGSINLTGASGGKSNDAAPMGIIRSGTTASNPPTTTPTTTTVTNDSASQTKMQKLNRAFMSWLDKQMVNHSVSNWAAGLQDYIKHADKILEAMTPEEVDKASEDSSKAATKSFFAAIASNGEKKADNKSATATGFGADSSKAARFGGFSAPPAAAPPKTTVGFGFGGSGSDSSLSKPATFTGFGSTKTPTTGVPASTGGFGFGSGAATGASVPSTNGFSAPVSGFKASAAPGASASTTAAAGDSEEYEGEPILEPEKIYKNENDKDEILYEADCKAFRFDTSQKEWKESGKGSLRMTREPGEQKKRVLVRNTLGKVTINAYIFKGMNFKQVGKAGLQFMAVVDDSGVPQSFLVKVRPADIQEALKCFKGAEQEAQ